VTAEETFTSADVRVVQRRRGFGLPLETAKSLRVMGNLVGKKLQGDVAAQLKVLRLVNNTYAATADPFDDA